MTSSAVLTNQLRRWVVGMNTPPPAPLSSSSSSPSPPSGPPPQRQQDVGGEGLYSPLRDGPRRELETQHMLDLAALALSRADAEVETLAAELAKTREIASASSDSKLQEMLRHLLATVKTAPQQQQHGAPMSPTSSPSPGVRHNKGSPHHTQPATTTDTELHEAREEVSRLQKLLDERTDELKVTQRSLRETEAGRDQQQALLQEGSMREASLREALREAKEAAGTAQREREDAIKKVTAAEVAAERRKNLLEMKEVEMQRVRQEMTRVEAEHQGNLKKIGILEAELARMQSAARQGTEDQDRLRRQRASADADVEALRRRVADADADINAMRERLSREERLNREIIEDLQHKMRQLRSTSDKAESQLAKTTAQLQDKELECRKVEKQLAEVQRELHSRPSKDELEEWIKKYGTATGELSQAKEQLMIKETEVDQLTAECKGLKSQMQILLLRIEKSTATAALDAEVSRLRDAMSPSKAQSLADGEFGSLRRQLLKTVLEVSPDDVDGRARMEELQLARLWVQQTKAECDAVRRNLADAEAEVTTLQAQNCLLKQQVDELKGVRTQLSMEQDSVRSYASQAKHADEELQKHKAKLATEVGRLEADVEAEQLQKRKLEAELRLVKGQLEEMELEGRRLRSEVAKFREMVQEKEDYIKVLKKREEAEIAKRCEAEAALKRHGKWNDGDQGKIRELTHRLEHAEAERARLHEKLSIQERLQEDLLHRLRLLMTTGNTERRGLESELIMKRADISRLEEELNKMRFSPLPKGRQSPSPPRLTPSAPDV